MGQKMARFKIERKQGVAKDLRRIDGGERKKIDTKGETTDYHFDSMNRLTNIIHQNEWKASFGYDQNDNLIEQTSPLAYVSFSYDSMNRPSSSIIRIHSREFAVTNSYDLNDNRANILYPGGLFVSYEYDPENRLSGVSVSAPSAPLQEFFFSYDNASRMTNLRTPDLEGS